MIEVTAERSIAAPPDALWPLVSDPARLPDWFTFAERVEVIDGGPDGPGQRRRQHGHWGKRRSEVDQVITRWEPPRALAWAHEAERLNGKPAPRFAASTDFTIELVPDGAGTARPPALGPGPRRTAARPGHPRLRAPRGRHRAERVARTPRRRLRAERRLRAVEPHGRQPVQADRSRSACGCSAAHRSATACGPARAGAAPGTRDRSSARRRRTSARRGRRSRRGSPSAPRTRAGGVGRWSSCPRPPQSSGSPAARRSERWRRTANTYPRVRTGPRPIIGPLHFRGMIDEEDVLEALSNVIDPELGLDFVELGLVYGVEIDGGTVNVTFTLTTPACPIGPQVSEQMKEFVGEIPGVEDVAGRNPCALCTRPLDAPRIEAAGPSARVDGPLGSSCGPPPPRRAACSRASRSRRTARRPSATRCSRGRVAVAALPPARPPSLSRVFSCARPSRSRRDRVDVGHRVVVAQQPEVDRAVVGHDRDASPWLAAGRRPGRRSAAGARACRAGTAGPARS